MNYFKPVVNSYEMNLEIKTLASEKTSCIGGHCVRARYGEDH